MVDNPAAGGSGTPDAAAAAAAKVTTDAAAAKATADKAAADKATADAAAAEIARTQPPEKYDLTLPDGGRLTESDLAEFETIARAQKWTNDQAKAAIAAHDNALKVQSERFFAETTADPTYGGAHLAESQRLANSVIDRIRPAGHARRESFMAFINRGGAGNHLEVVSFLADLGKLMAEDGSVGGRSGAGGATEVKDILYGAPKT